jgi:O-antigen/teichoic acid export membrane protein
LLALLISFGDIVIDKLYDERYEQATWMMPILGIGVWFSVLFYTLSPVLLAIGKPWYLSQSNLARLMAIGFGLPLGFSLMGVFGAIATVALSDLPSFLVLQYGLIREKLACIVQDLLATTLFIGVLAVILVIRSYSGLGLPLDRILQQ